jgi:hypothetical protein
MWGIDGVSRNSSKRNGPIAINATSLRPNQTPAWNDAEALRNLQVVEVDPLLIPHVHHLRYRFQEFLRQRSAIDKHEGGLEVFSRGQYPVRNANASLFLQVQDFCSRTQCYTGYFLIPKSRMALARNLEVFHYIQRFRRYPPGLELYIFN